MAKVETIRICVIGAGISGLCSIKSCLEENYDVVCFEKEADIGGMWNLKAKSHPTVPKSRITNTCKEMFAFSDFPPPAEWPAWLNVKMVNEYLKMYTERFDLLKHIKFNTNVEYVEQEKNGQWSVRTSDGKIETFDGILCCTGTSSYPFTPEVPGLDKFKGNKCHSASYSTFDQYDKKRVLVVGFGNSSADIAIELSRHAEQVYVSTGRGGWVWGKMGIRGWPVDVRYLNRLADKVFSWTPKYFLNNYFEHLVNMRIDHMNYGLRPAHRFWSQEPIYGDQIPTCLSNGSIILKEGVKMFKENSAVFDDDTEEDVDALIFCTGYTQKFAFGLEKFITMNQGRPNLYKNVFPPNLRSPTFAMIGYVRSMGGLGPLAEMQSRWAIRVFSKQISLPSRKDMEMDIKRDENRIAKDFYKSARFNIHVPYLEYMDNLATQIGVKPNLAAMVLNDPKLFYASLVGPCTGYQYRLKGPRAWSGARDAIVGTCDRIDQPLKTRRGEPAVWNVFGCPSTLKMRQYTDFILFLSCYIAFNTTDPYLFYVCWTIVFGTFIFISFGVDCGFDVSTTF